MAWCPKCDGDYPIVTSVTSHSMSVPTVTERYNQYGEYIGYEEGKSFRSDMQTGPRCSRCYSLFEFPNATSKEEYFYAKKQVVVDRWRARKPHGTFDDSPFSFISFLASAVSFTLGLFVATSITDNGGVALLVAFLSGIGAYLLSNQITGKNKKEKDRGKTITPEM